MHIFVVLAIRKKSNSESVIDNNARTVITRDAEQEQIEASVLVSSALHIDDICMQMPDFYIHFRLSFCIHRLRSLILNIAVYHLSSLH